ncbi:MAG: hypothetical protein ACLPHI_13765 [Terriglobales bacterium]
MRDNLFVPFMRPAVLIAIALGTSFSALASYQQAPGGSGAETGKVVATPANSQIQDASKHSPRGGAPEKPAAAKGSTKHSARAAQEPAGAPRKVVIRNGGAVEPAEQIIPGMTPAEAVRERENAERWLSSTDLQLTQLGARDLGQQQQETVSQIRNYMDGARSALKDGDVRRAGTLAEKAHLLSDDLAKH